MSKGRTANQRWMQTPSGISNCALALIVTATFSLLVGGVPHESALGQNPERQRSGLKSLWGRIGLGRDADSAAAADRSANRFMQMARQILGEAEKLAAAGNLEGAIQLAKRADTLARVAAGSSPARWDPTQQHPSEFLKELRAIQAERQPVQQPMEEPSGKVHISEPFTPQDTNSDSQSPAQAEPTAEHPLASPSAPAAAKTEFVDEPFPDQPESAVELVGDEDLQLFPADVGTAINVISAENTASPRHRSTGMGPGARHQEWTADDGFAAPAGSGGELPAAPQLPDPTSPYQAPLVDTAEQRRAATGLWKPRSSPNSVAADAQSQQLPVEPEAVAAESNSTIADDSGPVLPLLVEPQNTVAPQSQHIVHLAAPGISHLQPQSIQPTTPPIEAEGSSLLTLALLQTVSTFAGLLLGLIVFFVARYVIVQRFGDRIGLAKQSEFLHSPTNRDMFQSRQANSAEVAGLADKVDGDLPGVAFGDEPFPFRVVGSYAEEKEEEERQEQEREQAMIKHIFEENLQMQDQLERLKTSVA